MDFKETNRRSIHVLPHTWITIKRINAVLTDGTVIPCRDFQAKAIEFTQDDDIARLIGTVNLPVSSISSVNVVLDKTGQCSEADGASLTPCTFTAETPRAVPANNDSSNNEITLTATLASRDRETQRLVLQLGVARDKRVPRVAIPVTLTCTGYLPASVDLIETPWFTHSPNPGQVPQSLPFALLPSEALPQAPTLLSGKVDPDTKAFTPRIAFDNSNPSCIVVAGTVVRLDIAKQTFQLRVNDSSDGQPYGTLYFRVSDQTKFRFADGHSDTAASFDDISIGRQLWVQIHHHPDADSRLEPLEIRILDQNGLMP